MSGPFDPPQGPGQPYPVAPGAPIGTGPMRRNRLPLFIGLGVLVLVIGVIFVVEVVSVLNQKASAGTAGVGDCIGSLPPESGDTNVSADHADKVDCSSSDAQAKVLGVLTGRTESDFNNIDPIVLCQAYPGTDSAYFEAIGDKSPTGTILCLRKLK